MSKRYGATRATGHTDVEMPAGTDAEAARWALRLQRGLDARERAAFEAWLVEDAAHAEALSAMQDTARRLRAMSGTQLAAARPARRAWLRRVGLPAAGAAGLAVVAGGGWLAWQGRDDGLGAPWRVATARGEIRPIALPDGSQLVLDTQTQVDVRYGEHGREITVHEGQGWLSVQADPARPLVVHAGGLRIAVVGTQFTVRHTRSGLDAGGVRVVVEAGRVRVRRAQPGWRELVGESGLRDVSLSVGQAYVLDASGRSGVVPAPASGATALWREGRLDFEDTPLAQALEEFGRYGVTGAVIKEPAIGAWRVGGSYSLRNLAGFLAALAQQLPVQVEQGATGVFEIRAL